MNPKQLLASFVKVSHATLACLAVTLLFTGSNGAAASLSNLLEQGIYCEESNGELGYRFELPE